MDKLIKPILLLSFILFGLAAQSQQKHVVYLSDKSGTTYSLSSPLSMISQRTWDKRQKYGIGMDSMDIPVNSNYINQISSFNAQVIRKSKWLNALVIECDSSTLDSILALNFVISNDRIFKRAQPNKFPELEPGEIRSSGKKARTNILDYGAAENQIKMLGADVMHADGYDGSGLWMGVFDAGFRNMDTISHFQELYNNNQILGTYDIVDGDQTVYDEHTHGTSVMSCIAANSPGEIIGTGFGASFLLFRTEDANSETELEEFNWLVAAEMADSMGVDIINTSLGYSSMDNSAFSHTYNDMDGKTTIISRAATIAARKGVLCVNSAGNEGNDPWFYITAPADADSILTVGAVGGDSVIANFSSRGPSFDGRIKPNVVAQGFLTTVVSATSGNVTSGSGTSFSSPLMAGFVAGLWQAYPEMSNLELIELIENSAHQTLNPDNEYGYGIPNYGKAKFLNSLQDIKQKDEIYQFAPNPYSGETDLYLVINENLYQQEIEMEIYDLMGRLLDSFTIIPELSKNKLNLEDNVKNSDFLIVKLKSSLGTRTFKLIKQ